MEKKEKLKYSVMVGFIVLIIVIGNLIGAVTAGAGYNSWATSFRSNSR